MVGTAPPAVAGKRSLGNWAAGGASRKRLRRAGPSRGSRAGAPRGSGAQPWHPRSGPDRQQASGELSAVADLPPGRRAAAAHQRALQNAPDPRATAREAAPANTLLPRTSSETLKLCHGDQTTHGHNHPHYLGAHSFLTRACACACDWGNSFPA